MDTEGNLEVPKVGWKSFLVCGNYCTDAAGSLSIAPPPTVVVIAPVNPREVLANRGQKNMGCDRDGGRSIGIKH